MSETGGDRPSGRYHESSVGQFLEEHQLVVVSNREPYSHDCAGDDVEVTRPAGGLTAAIDPALQTVGGTWIAWGSGSADHAVVDGDDRVRVPPEDPRYALRRVWLDEAELDALYRHADVALVTPVRDGLNLVAKEFVAGTDDGVLVLSDAAGVAEELSEYTLTVTPMDVEAFAEGIRRAVELPSNGRERQTAALKSIVESSGTDDWIRRFFAPLAADADPPSDEVHTIGD